MDDDRELSRLFAELRRSEEASAPPFREALERARVRKPSLAALRFAAVAAVFAVAALTVVLLRRPAREAAGQEPPATLAQWKSPTDWLLETPGSEILGELPPSPVPRYTELGGAEGNRTPVLVPSHSAVRTQSQ